MAGVQAVGFWEWGWCGVEVRDVWGVGFVAGILVWWLGGWWFGGEGGKVVVVVVVVGGGGGGGCYW